MPGMLLSIAPRITETAKTLGAVYVGLTVACALALWAAGMSLFDAICHAFSTLALGGFSTHDAKVMSHANSVIKLADGKIADGKPVRDKAAGKKVKAGKH